MNTLSQVPNEMQYLFTTKADAAGLETGLIQRSCKLNGSCFTQMLVFRRITHLPAWEHH